MSDTSETLPTDRALTREEQNKLLTELERSNQALKEFAYIVSHDLKAPLRAISSLVQWITEDYVDVVDEDGQEQLELLSSRVKRMEGLIDGILQYSRVGRVCEASSLVNLNTLLPQVIDLLAPDPQRYQITYPTDLPTISGDKTRIHQLFQNLLSNAIKFNDKEVGEISIHCAGPEDNLWTFTVSDNGPGIDPKHHETVFQIFQTLQARDEYESTGVGLTLVKKIVQLHSGTVWVTSEPGLNCTFHFTWPVHVDA
ncbi:MAG: hypothetical protein HQL54_00835 [Magnetococcales bacterium]|nr:hypothetical protein [Magnetococcales bacterium]